MFFKHGARRKGEGKRGVGKCVSQGGTLCTKYAVMRLADS